MEDSLQEVSDHWSEIEPGSVKNGIWFIRDHRLLETSRTRGLPITNIGTSKK